jgi:hypothetical protein
MALDIQVLVGTSTPFGEVKPVNGFPTLSPENYIISYYVCNYCTIS